MSKTIVVTGASTGIGYATSLALAKTGYDVFAGVRSLSAGEPLVKAASSLPGKITPILLEVTDHAQINAAAGRGQGVPRRRAPVRPGQQCLASLMAGPCCTSRSTRSAR